VHMSHVQNVYSLAPDKEMFTPLPTFLLQYPYVRTGFAMRISCRTRGFRPPDFAYATRHPFLNKGFECGSHEVQTLKPLACALAGAA